MTPQRPILKEENTHKELDVNEKSKVFIKNIVYLGLVQTKSETSIFNFICFSRCFILKIDIRWCWVVELEQIKNL